MGRGSARGASPSHWLGRLAVGALLLVGCVAAFAAEEACYEYSITYSSGWSGSDVGTGSSPASACADLVSKMDGSVSGSTPSYTYHVVHSGTTEWNSGTLTFGCSITTTRTNNTTGEGPFPYGAGTGSFGGGSRTEVDCPEDPCEDMYGTVAAVGLDAAVAVHGDNCVNGCKVQRSEPMMRFTGGGFSIAAAVHTGQSCDAEPPAPEGNCFILGGQTLCMEFDEGEGGETGVASVGPDKFRPNTLSGCRALSSGGVACTVEGPGATTAVPDDGDEVDPQPATPTAQITGGGKTVNYYSSSVVSNSTSTVVTNNSTGNGSAGSGSGPGEGEEGGGEASGGTGCDAAPSCTGDSVGCALLHQEWLARCPAAITGADITSAVGEGGDIGTEEVEVGSLTTDGPLATGGGSCPAPLAIAVNGDTIDLDIFGPICSLLDLLAPVIMACAYLAGIFIVMAPKRIS